MGWDLPPLWARVCPSDSVSAVQGHESWLELPPYFSSVNYSHFCYHFSRAWTLSVIIPRNHCYAWRRRRSQYWVSSVSGPVGILNLTFYITQWSINKAFARYRLIVNVQFGLVWRCYPILPNSTVSTSYQTCKNINFEKVVHKISAKEMTEAHIYIYIYIRHADISSVQ